MQRDGRALLLAVVFTLLLAPLPIHAGNVSAPGIADAGDLDPAVLPLLDALLRR